MRLVFLFLCVIYYTSCQQKKQAKHFEIKKANSVSKTKVDSTEKN
ncbi:hypothetical protein HDC90_001350 [Pedobacter sp. AK013]|nr:hypothetical protein [Pedobacter sp. AK013]